ncbi:MAG TPA: c-type cytochrome [Candidatus Obscuribacterales bacterium]
MNTKLAGQFLLISASAAALATAWSASDSKAKAPNRGETLYMANCEACHMQGKNVIKPDKEIVTSSKLASESLFQQYLSEKHGYMPAFPDIAAKDRDLRALYKYVRRLKMQSWAYEPKEPDVIHDPEKVSLPNEPETSSPQE